MRCLLIALAALLALSSGMAAGEAPSSADTVTRFHAALIQSMHDGDTSSCVTRESRLAPAVDAAFDVTAISQRALRRRWGELDEAQRTRFVAVFRELVIATYVSRFRHFGGERFETLDSQTQAGGAVLVHARLTPGSGAPLAFDYLLQAGADGHYRIVNVIVDGVSDLALRATQYEQIFRQKGYEGLIADAGTQTADARRCR